MFFLDAPSGAHTVDKKQAAVPVSQARVFLNGRAGTRRCIHVSRNNGFVFFILEMAFEFRRKNRLTPLTGNHVAIEAKAFRHFCHTVAKITL